MMKSTTSVSRKGNENIEGAASLAEARRIREIVNRHRRPGGVLTWNAHYGEDSTGEPAVWIWFQFRDDYGISQSKIHELTDFVRSVRDDLLDARLGRWPYVGFRNPPM
jgi:hypothetical protein